MISCRNILLLICSLVNIASVRGANLITNGEFTASLSSWNQVGTVFDTGETAVLSDATTLRTLVFQTAAVPGGAILQGLSFDLLTALSPAAGLGQTPDTVFISAFLGSEPFGQNLQAGLYQTAIGVLDADYRGPANPAAQLTSGPSPKGQGWTRYFLPLPTQPYVTVAFEFIDGNGIAGDSTTAVDNVRLDAVLIPEPSGTILAILAGLLCTGRRRRV